TQGNIELADLIDCFRKLIPFKDRLLTTINNKLNGEFGDQRTKTIFYDIVPTNLYMVPRDMLEKIRVHNLEELSKEMKELAKKCHEAGTLPDQCFDAEGNVVVEKIPEWFYDQMEPSRTFYYSKMHVRVSVGFAFDRNGLPLDFEVYQGEFSEFEKLEKFAEKLKKIYKPQHIVRVVNPALKIKPYLVGLLKEGFGFLINQKIDKLDQEQKTWIFSPEGYCFVNPRRPDEGKYKVLKDWRRPQEKNQLPVNCNLVGVFNTQGKRLYLEILKVKAEMEKDKAKKAKIEEVYRAVEAPKLTKSGLPAKSKSEKWNASDFNAIVYNFGITSEFKSVPDDAENTATDAILAVRTYRAMNQMRTYLRTIMDNFDMPGPGIVTFRDIQAHFFTCMLSLLLLRILQIRIQEKSGFAISIKQIVETLDEAELAVLVL
ncbi:MAG: hypothetical protein LUC43_01480, partial [Burkholderiales bacterium]|nr:hypothetical protein [Burkholderiales bacterium]